MLKRCRRRAAPWDDSLGDASDASTSPTSTEQSTPSSGSAKGKRSGREVAETLPPLSPLPFRLEASDGAPAVMQETAVVDGGGGGGGGRDAGCPAVPVARLEERAVAVALEGGARATVGSQRPTPPTRAPLVPLAAAPGAELWGTISNYDVLCSSHVESFSNYTGSRRFRVLMGTWLDHYEALQSSATGRPHVVGKARRRQFLDDVLASLASCRPPCRFLELDPTGKWQLLDEAYARTRIQQTLQDLLRSRDLLA